MKAAGGDTPDLLSLLPSPTGTFKIWLSAGNLNSRLKRRQLPGGQRIGAVAVMVMKRTLVGDPIPADRGHSTRHGGG